MLDEAPTLDVAALPAFDGERLLYVCTDPFGEGRFAFMFSDGTVLLVLAAGACSRWLEEPHDLQMWTRGARTAWAWVPAPVRAEVHRRCSELQSYCAPRA